MDGILIRMRLLSQRRQNALTAVALGAVVVGSGCGASGATSTITVTGPTVTSTTTTTVTSTVQETVPSGTHELTARIITPGCSLTDKGDTFTLRAPGNGLTDGDVLSTPDYVGVSGCWLVLKFPVDPSIRFFVVQDEISGYHWGPVGVAQLPGVNWTLRLKVTS